MSESIFEIQNLGQVQISCSINATDQRDDAILDSKLAVKVVENDDQLATASEKIKALRKMVREAERAAGEVKKPFLDRAKTVRFILDEFLQPLTDEMERLKALSDPYAIKRDREIREQRAREAEELRKAQEDKRRMEAARKAAETPEQKQFAGAMAVDAAKRVQTAVNKPKPKPVAGVKTREHIDVTITDVHLLYDKRPDLCDAPKARIMDIKRAIKELKEGESIPGVDFKINRQAII